jgi:succinoglycan biosynthesis protein ExoA
MHSTDPTTTGVTVVMAARDAAGSVGDTIEAILGQDHAGPVEVVVAVPPDDGTRDALARFGESVRVVDNPGMTAPRGLNAAIAAASGSVIVRCDAHAILPPHYLRTALEVLDESGADVVGGIQRPVGSTVLQRAVAVAQSTPLGVGDARYRLGGSAGPVDTVYLGVFRREAMDRLGGYAEDLDRNQDYELNHRIRDAGGTVWFDPRLVVDYRPRRGLRDLWRQYFSYGRWKRVVVRRHRGSMRWRQAAAPLLVVGLVASAVAAAAGAGPIAAVIPGAYLAGTIVTGLVEAVRRRDGTALLAPVPLAVMHLAWGVGFLVGVGARRGV